MIKILSVFGTRPEAVKLAPVIQEIKNHSSTFISRVCVTAQHREMLDQVLNLFEIEPDYDLNLMRAGQTLHDITARILLELPPILQAEQPDWILVQGDTTTVMATAIAAYYEQIKVGHVEAGLRTFDKYQPFPEEVNRRITSVIADLNFAPTEISRRNLLHEGTPANSIVVTGNPVIDALKWVSALPHDIAVGPLAEIPWEKRIILLTAHRRENFGAPLESICNAINKLTINHHKDVHFVYPVHLNPSVQSTVTKMLGNNPNVTLLPPLDYLDLVHLMKRAYLVLTDSGGIQEEAPGLGKPVLVLRKTTERPEAVEAGTVRLIGTDTNDIIHWTNRLLDEEETYKSMAQAVNPYGDGNAARRIVAALQNMK